MPPKNLDDFNEWAEANKEWVKEFVIILWDRYDRGVQTWLEHEGKSIRAWLFANPERSKKNWRKFVANWLKKSYDEMTIGEEGHFKMKRELSAAYTRIEELEATVEELRG